MGSATKYLRQTATRILNRPRLRPLLQVAAAAYISSSRQLCWPFYRGAWIHRYGDGYVIGGSIGGRSPRMLEERTRDQFFRHYTPSLGDVILDVGAANGEELFAFSRGVGQSGHVYSFEAHPKTFRHLRMNRALNRLRNVTVVNAAVYDSPGFLQITDSSRHLGNNVLTARGSGLRVPAITLDDYVRAHGITRIAFVKMNIEGAEVPALRGATYALSITDCLCICCHDFKAERERDDSFRTKAEVSRILATAGFRIVRQDDHPKPWGRDHLHGLRDVAQPSAGSRMTQRVIPKSLRFGGPSI